MSLAAYIAMKGFSQPERDTLSAWHATLALDDAWRLIQRNVDCECVRGDIDEPTFDDFLHQVAASYVPGRDPVEVIDRIFAVRRSSFVLAGRWLPVERGPLARFMRLDHFERYQLGPAVPISRDLRALKTALEGGIVTGAYLVGSTVGRSGYPVWVTRGDDLPVGATAKDLRDRLGLKHIDHGHLVEVRYADVAMGASHGMTRAPTVLDAAALGADNWIFAKRAGTGGPDWGHTVDLARATPDLPEAVHRDFCVTEAHAASMTVRYVGHIPSSPPSVNFGNLLGNL
jgi:hypothetical protein